MNIKDITSVIKGSCYISKLKESGDRTLKNAIKNLNFIPAASVESERVLSGFAKIATKIRSTLNQRI